MVEKDLRQKRVFLTGPRPVEKTHLTFDLLKKSTNGVYLTSDNLEELGSASLSANQGKKEVDFALAVEDQPPNIIEATLSESDREARPAGPRDLCSFRSNTKCNVVR